MKIRSTSVLNSSPAVGKCNLIPVADVLPGPSAAVDLIEEVTARELPFTAPDATTHARVTYAEGPDRFVSFSPRTFTEQDDCRQFLCVELGRVYLDGAGVEPGSLDDPLAEALEEWALGLQPQQQEGYYPDPTLPQDPSECYPRENDERFLEEIEIDESDIHSQPEQQQQKGDVAKHARGAVRAYLAALADDQQDFLEFTRLYANASEACAAAGVTLGAMRQQLMRGGAR
jgi:hypothetical protein